MALTAAVINQAKPGDKRYMLKDENGLYLEVPPTGKKLWRVRYWFQGKENRVGVEAYPKITLAEARTKCAAIKDQIADGIDPVKQKKEEKLEKQVRESSTLLKIAEAWLDRMKPS